LNQILEFKSTTKNKNDGDEAPVRREGGARLFWVAKQKKKMGGRVGYHVQAHMSKLKEREKKNWPWMGLG